MAVARLHKLNFLVERLIKEKASLNRSVSFPNYDSDASMPIKMYLSGQFGKDVD